ncbi:hypothetical protein ACTWBQ_001063 [Citrobacter amalonaticus]
MLQLNPIFCSIIYRWIISQILYDFHSLTLKALFRRHSLTAALHKQNKNETIRNFPGDWKIKYFTFITATKKIAADRRLIVLFIDFNQQVANTYSAHFYTNLLVLS